MTSAGLLVSQTGSFPILFKRFELDFARLCQAIAVLQARPSML
jgi:hypothetical protein